MPFALSLPSLQPQIPPQPKGRLSAPSSRAARNSEFWTVPPAWELREAASLWRRAGGRAKRALYLIQATPPHLPCALGESSCHWLSHFARQRRSAAAKPKAVPVWGRCSLQEGIRFGGEACLPVFVPLRAGSGAGFGRGGPQAAPRLGTGKRKGERLQPTCRSHVASVPTFNPWPPPHPPRGAPQALF